MGTVCGCRLGKRLIARSGTGALATLLAWGASSLLWAGEPGARAVFWRLPTTIFENTVPGLSENEKYELLVQGATEPSGYPALLP